MENGHRNSGFSQLETSIYKGFSMAMLNNKMVYSVSFTGWWLTYPSEKYESVGMIIPNIWKNTKCSIWIVKLECQGPDPLVVCSKISSASCHRCGKSWGLGGPGS